MIDVLGAVFAIVQVFTLWQLLTIKTLLSIVHFDNIDMVDIFIGPR